VASSADAGPLARNPRGRRLRGLVARGAHAPAHDAIERLLRAHRAAHPRADLESLHTTVIGPGDELLQVLIRTEAMHSAAEHGIVARLRDDGGRTARRVGTPAARRSDDLEWLRRLVDWQQDAPDPGQFLESLRHDLSDHDHRPAPPAGCRGRPAGGRLGAPRGRQGPGPHAGGRLPGPRRRRAALRNPRRLLRSRRRDAGLPASVVHQLLSTPHPG
jgi:hypothetical protein